MYQFENLHGKPLTEQVEDHIMKYIVENEIQVGSKMPNEFELAELFGVGRSTIREAIKILASKNVLEVRRGAGTFVLNTEIVGEDPLGLREMKDKYSLALDLITVRLILEPEIAVMAAENATEEDIEELLAQCRLVESLIQAGVDHTEEDIKFHTCIAKCSKNAVVENLIPIIHSAVSVFANLTHLKLREETIRTHRDIAEAISVRDGIGARCAMNMHMTYNRQMILRIIEEEKREKRKQL